MLEPADLFFTLPLSHEKLFDGVSLWWRGRRGGSGATALEVLQLRRECFELVLRRAQASLRAVLTFHDTLYLHR